MSMLRNLIAGLLAIFKKQQSDTDLDEELDNYLESSIAEKMKSGMSRKQALREARMEMGSMDSVKEEIRSTGWESIFASLWQDVRYTLRMLRKSPGFTAVAVLTLALGIGANTAIFSMAYAFLVQPLSFPHLDRVVAVVDGRYYRSISPANYLDLKNQSKSFAALTVYREEDVNLTGEGVPERVYGSRVTADFFAVVGVTPQLGRPFLPKEDEAGLGQVAILSHGLWEERFGGDPNVLGKTIDLNGQRCTIVGVMPEDFDFPVPTDIWLPLAITANERAERKNATLAAIGLLKPGISLKQAQAEGAPIGTRLAAAYPQVNNGFTIRALPIVESVGGSITRDYSFLLLVAVGIVLLITCSNIANLQLARSMSRQRELAVRAALGASRLRIARLLLTENFLMAILGGAASIGLANWSLNLMGSSMPADIARQIPGWYEIRFDTRALLYTLAIALVSGMLTGLMPAFASSRTALNQSLKQSERSWGTGRSHQRLRGAFVIAQIVVALVLVIAATLMVKGFRRFVNVQENYSPEHLLIVAVNLPESRYKTAADRESFYRRALDKLHSISGVVSADTFYTIPLSNNGTQWIHFTIEGRTPGGSLRQYPGAILQQVSPDYLQALNIPLVAVRTFTDADRDGSQPVAMVSQKLARAYWPGDTAIGRHIRIGGPDSKQPWLTIVGVTSNVLYDWTDQLPELAIYVPYMQSPPSETLLAIRTNGQPAKNYAKPARAAIAGIDPDLPAFNVMPLSQAIHESIVGLAIVGDMMAVLGAIALIIALVGVYGVMSYAVAERTHEFGVRMALGARPRDILWLVSRRGILLVSASVAIGLPLSIALARLLAGLIYGASAIDWRVFGGVTTLLTIVAFLASYIPARRAMRVDPMVALRYE